MKKLFEILSILDKNKPNTLNEDQLPSLFANDPEAFDTYKKYQVVASAIRSQDHPDADTLAAYVLGELPVKKAEPITQHIRDCSVCDETISELQSELNGIDLYLKNTINNKHTGFIQKANIFFHQSSPLIRYAAAAVVIIGLSYSSIYTVSVLTTSKNFMYGNLQSEQNFSISRGRQSDAFDEALYAIDQKDFSNAITALKKDIAANTNDQSIFYSHYILALTYFHAAYSAPLGLFPHYDKALITDAKSEFAECIRLNRNPQLNNISLDACFFSAKASILLDDRVSAKQGLQKVIDGKGSKMQEAKDLLLRIK